MKEQKKKDEDEKVIKAAIDDIHHEYGDGSLFVGMEDKQIIQCPAISTRCISLDLALGIGGVPRGRVIEIFGPESSGKTTLAATIVAQAQSEGDLAAYIDVEYALDPVYLKNGIGCNLKRLLISEPDSGEQALKIVEKLVATNKVGVIVVDSVAALVPQCEIDGEIGDQFYAPQARLMSQALRKLQSMVAKTKTCLIFINQIRDKMNSMPGSSPETTPGGKALKFYASVRLDIRRVGSLSIGTDKKQEKIGNETLVKVVKNKVSVRFKTANFVILFGKGISKEMSIIDMGVKMGIIEKSPGSWLGYNGNRMGQGRIQALEFLKKCPDISAEIDKKIRESFIKSTEEGTETIEIAAPAETPVVEGVEGTEDAG